MIVVGLILMITFLGMILIYIIYSRGDYIMYQDDRVNSPMFDNKHLNNPKIKNAWQHKRKERNEPNKEQT